MDLQKFQQAYEIIKVRENQFEFTSNFLVTYRIYLLEGKDFLPNFIFSDDTWCIGFYPMALTIPFKDKAYRQDKKVMRTVMNFIIDMLETKETIVAFSYSSHKKLHRAREKYFGDLYEDYNNKQLHKIDFKLENNENARIIFRCDNPNFAKICTITSQEIIGNIRDKDI